MDKKKQELLAYVPLILEEKEFFQREKGADSRESKHRVEL